MIFDIDRFKAINDTYGHATGNHVLAEFAHRLSSLARGGEMLARVGGEEFAWIMPETDAAGAMAAAERARSAIEGTPFGEAGCVTTSAGVCELAELADPDQLFRHADVALYWAKRNGRNRTVRYRTDDMAFRTAEEQDRRVKDASTMAAVRALAVAVDAKDAMTKEHSERVAGLATALAEQAGWNDEQIAMLRDAAMVHDIGKIGVPDRVLLKPGRLDEDEYEQIKQHAALGAQMVCDVVEPIQASWIRHHHERFDGRGYPDGIGGDDIPEAPACSHWPMPGTR